MQDVTHNPDLHMIEPAANFDDLVDNFGLFDDWEDRYRYIIDLGKKLPVFPEDLKTDTYKVRGCMSQVWIIPGHVDVDQSRFAFAADSDAHIVKGLIHVLASLYTGKEMGQVAAVDAEAAFAQLGLDQHLSPSRRNGLVAMVARIRAAASQS
jgi:cysteine desulfuration protein SufE